MRSVVRVGDVRRRHERGPTGQNVSGRLAARPLSVLELEVARADVVRAQVAAHRLERVLLRHGLHPRPDDDAELGLVVALRHDRRDHDRLARPDQRVRPLREQQRLLRQLDALLLGVVPVVETDADDLARTLDRQHAATLTIPVRRYGRERRVIRFVAVGDLMVDVAAEGTGHQAHIARRSRWIGPQRRLRGRVARSRSRRRRTGGRRRGRTPPARAPRGARRACRRRDRRGCPDGHRARRRRRDPRRSRRERPVRAGAPAGRSRRTPFSSPGTCRRRRSRRHWHARRRRGSRSTRPG